MIWALWEDEKKDEIERKPGLYVPAKGMTKVKRVRDGGEK